MTDQEAKQRIVNALKASPSVPLQNIFYVSFPELWQNVKDHQNTTAFKETMPQVLGLALEMWKNGEIKATRNYDKRSMPFGEGCKRPDKITDYDRKVWFNCWHLFSPVAWEDNANVGFSL